MKFLSTKYNKPMLTLKKNNILNICTFCDG